MGLYAASLAIAPKISIDVASLLIPLIVCAFLLDCQISDFINLDNMPNITPCPNTLHNNLKNSRQRIYMKIASLVMLGVAIVIQHDKGK